MSKKDEKIAQLQTEIKFLRSSRLSEQIVSVLNNLIKWGAFVWIAYYSYKSIKALAGEITLAEIGIELLTNIDISVTIAWCVGIVGLIYGLNQKKLRKDTIERIQKQNQELESIIDNNRTTSQLTKRGDTRPEDRT